MAKRNQALGQGLAAILRDVEEEKSSDLHSNQQTHDQEETSIASMPGYKELAIDSLAPSPFQPRKVFDDVELSELSASIQKNGVLQPLIVRSADEGRYEIIAGERRWRAAQKANMSQVPVVVKDITDEEAIIIAFVENIQREDLTALEEAEGLQKLTEEMGESQEYIAQMIGKSRSYVANVLRLNKLPEEVKTLLRRGEISAGIARSLVGHPNAVELAKLAVKNKLNVREIENLAQKMKKEEDKEDSSKKTRSSVQKVFSEGDQEKIAAEKAIENALGLKAKLTLGSKKKVLSVEFETMEQLDALLEKLTT